MCTYYLEAVSNLSSSRQSILLAAQNVVCGQAAGCTLHTADAFGNVVLTGGANVQGHLSLQTPEVSQRIEVLIFICHLCALFHTP